MDTVSERLCAVVVTFHPDAQVLENLVLLARQVERVVVVDNGSTKEELTTLRGIHLHEGLELIENESNLGIAAALNEGVRWAQAAGFGWVLLFDQDSRVTERFAAAMQEGFRTSGFGDRLAILVPRYVDMRTGEEIPQPPIVDGSIEQASTSGSLMPMSVFDRFGFFMEELFIDGVDYEYSLRVRAAGMGIEECRAAVLLHSPGSPTRHRLLWWTNYKATNYSPVRRYYQERNKMLTMRRYWRRFPTFYLRQFTISAKDLLKVMMVEQDKWTKVAAFLRGWAHGLMGITGKAR